MKPITLASLLFLAAELSIALPSSPNNPAINDQTRNSFETTEASNEVRRLSKHASPKLSRSLDFLKIFIPKKAKRNAIFLGDHDDKVKPKERPNNNKDLAGEFPNVGLIPFLTRPTSSPNPFDAGNGRPFTGHGPVVAATTDIENVSSPSTTHKPSSTRSGITYSSNPVPAHVPYPYKHPEPPHNSTTGVHRTHHWNGCHNHTTSDGSDIRSKHAPHPSRHPRPPHKSTTGIHRTHHRNGDHHSTKSEGSHRHHGPHATPAPGWIDGNLNLIPPALLKLTSFIIAYNGLTVTEPVPLGVPTPSWIDFNPVTPTSLDSRPFITSYKTVAKTEAISRETPTPEWDDTKGNFIAPSLLSLSSSPSVTIHSAATTASFSPEILSAQVPQFKGPKKRRNSMEGQR